MQVIQVGGSFETGHIYEERLPDYEFLCQTQNLHLVLYLTDYLTIKYKTPICNQVEKDIPYIFSKLV